MKKFNYRHSLKTLNYHLETVGYKVVCDYHSNIYVFLENQGRVCFYAYNATDAAEITNKLLLGDFIEATTTHR
jgi:hypothetical protein